MASSRGTADRSLPPPGDVLARAANVRVVAFDVDGVLTDGSLYFGADGAEQKAFHARDGHGLKMLKASGVEICIITGRSSTIVAQRMAELGIRHVYQGQEEKRGALETLLRELNLPAAQAAYVGDDIVDLPAMLHAGLAIAVADAHPLVRRHAHWRTPNGGGRGAARDVCELIMTAKGTFEAQIQKYLG